MSLQTYLKPFVSKGTYSNVRQLWSTPRAANYNARFAAYDNPSTTSDPGGFNVRELQSNVVFRLEYKPGSTLFVVWNDGRHGSTQPEGADTFGGQLRELFRLHPANMFLVRLAYWMNRSSSAGRS